MSKCVTHHNACDCREAMFARAIEIADECMTAMLITCADRVDESSVIWALIDAGGANVATLEEADDPLIEAVTWLRSRGLCAVVESSHGATVVLLSRMRGQG